MTLGNGLVDQRTYDQSYGILTHTITPIVSNTYVYTLDAFVASVTDNLSAANNRTFGYDGADRLVTADGPWGNGGFTYDLNGNRLTKTEGPSTTNYNYDLIKRNRLTSTTGAEVASYAYDDAGMITGDRTYTYDYSPPTMIWRANSYPYLEQWPWPCDVLYHYDGDSRQVYQASRYLYCEHDQLERWLYYDSQSRVLSEQTLDSDLLPPADDFIRDYVWLGNAPLAQISRDVAGIDSLYYYHTDYLGTPQRMTDTAQGVVWGGEYLPFGDFVSDPTSTAVENNLRFQGQYSGDRYFHVGPGLYQNWHRDYDPRLGRYRQPDPLGVETPSGYLTPDPMLRRFLEPETGRLLSRDPLGEFANGMGGAQDANLYAYVGNSPLNFIDPLGLCGCGQTGDYLSCLSNCIQAGDPLGYSAAPFAPIPKVIPEKVGLVEKAIRQPGGSRFTTITRVIGHRIGGAAATAGRAIGRAGAAGAVTYGVYLVGLEGFCAVDCALDSCSFPD